MLLLCSLGWMVGWWKRHTCLISHMVVLDMCVCGGGWVGGVCVCGGGGGGGGGGGACVRI